MSGVPRSPSGGDRAEAPGASHDSPSKGVRARHPFRAIVAAVPFRRVRRARPVALQPCPTPCRSRVAGTSRVAELRDRAESMLLGEGERPRASGMQPAAAQATNGLVIDLRHATAQLWASSAESSGNGSSWALEQIHDLLPRPDALFHYGLHAHMRSLCVRRS